MIVLLDTSTPVCRLGIEVGTDIAWHEWQANRQLAKGLLGYIVETLGGHGMDLHEITAIGVYRGPGGFTGLRIGLTVANTLAESLNIPIVGTDGDAWAQLAMERIAANDNDRIVLPNYGADANITKPRK